MNNKKSILVFVLSSLGYLFFQHSVASDDLRFLEMAKIYGARTVFFQYFEGSWYPLFQLISLGGRWCQELFAFLFFFVFVFWALKIHGNCLGSIISALALLMLGNTRVEFNSSLGFISHSHWVFLITGLLFLTQKSISKSQTVYLCLTTLVSGLPGVLFPAVALTERGIKKSIAIFLCVVLYMLMRQALPVAELANMQAGLTRNTDFELPIYLAVFFIQGFLGYLPMPLDYLKIASANLVATPAMLLVPYMLFWVPLLGFLGGFRYGVAVVWASICCLVFSLAPDKSHMLFYPNHGHYLHWVGFASVVGLCIFVYRKFEVQVIVDALKGVWK